MRNLALDGDETYADNGKCNQYLKVQKRGKFGKEIASR
jgi:hypothetical protein